MFMYQIISSKTKSDLKVINILLTAVSTVKTFSQSQLTPSQYLDQDLKAMSSSDKKVTKPLHAHVFCA